MNINIYTYTFSYTYIYIYIHIYMRHLGNPRALLLTARLQPPSISNLIAASIYDRYLVGPSIRLICTRCCFTMTHMIQVCGNWH